MAILRPVRGRGDSCGQYVPRSHAKHLTASLHACYIPICGNSIFQSVPRKSAVFDSTIGRWQTKDPKSFDAGDTNLYRYVGNHPSYATDPSGLEEPYVGPSIEILNSHKDAGGLDYQIRKVASSELDQLYAAGLLSQYAYIEAQDLLSLHSRVRVAISRRLRNGIRAIEGATRVNGAIEAAAGAVEAAEGVVLLVPTVGGSFVMVVHGLDHTQAGTRSMFTGIDQNTFVATGAEYVGEHGLGLNKESARSLGQLTEFGSDIVAPIAMIRSARIGMLNSQVDDLAPSSAAFADQLARVAARTPEELAARAERAAMLRRVHADSSGALHRAAESRAAYQFQGTVAQRYRKQLVQYDEKTFFPGGGQLGEVDIELRSVILEIAISIKGAPGKFNQLRAYSSLIQNPNQKFVGLFSKHRVPVDTTYQYQTQFPLVSVIDDSDWAMLDAFVYHGARH
jgi:hypothetical protein